MATEKPITKSKIHSLDGVNFRIYVQRFESDGTIYVGASAAEVEDPKKRTTFPAKRLGER